MPNHFHFALRIKSDEELISFFIGKDLTGFENLSGLVNKIPNLISKQFSNLFNSYSKVFNKQQNRRGTLFEKPFKRSHIDSDEYFRNMIPYIHFNPVHHSFVKDLRDWPYSSFESFLTDKASNLRRKEVIAWFDGKENFFSQHGARIDKKMIADLEYL